MSVVGIVIPMGYCHQDQPSDETTIYPLPFRLATPYLTFEKVPRAEELPPYFSRIVSDVKQSYQPANVIRGVDCFMTSEIHVSHVEIAFYTGFCPGTGPKDWWEALAAVEGQELAGFRFDGQEVEEAPHGAHLMGR